MTNCLLYLKIYTKNSMILKDKNIQDLVDTHTPVKIGDNEFYIEPNSKGSCEGCYFINKTCHMKAVNICCSNGGNILKLKDN